MVCSCYGVDLRLKKFDVVSSITYNILGFKNGLFSIQEYTLAGQSICDK